MRKRRVRWHFLRRKADERAEQLRRWQREAKAGDYDATERLRALDVRVTDRIEVERQGKWDARFWVVVS